MTFFDKDTLRKSIAPKVTSVYQVLHFDPYPAGVVLSDIVQTPPLAVYVEVSPGYVAQVRRWEPGTRIRAIIRSEIFTIEEKVAEMGWSEAVCEKVFQETGYAWDHALVQYYFEGKIEECHEEN
jgi:hypothetical protein